MLKNRTKLGSGSLVIVYRLSCGLVAVFTGIACDNVSLTYNNDVGGEQTIIDGTEDTSDLFTGIVKVNDGCSGTLIDSTHVLTAGHCVCDCIGYRKDACSCSPTANVTFYTVTEGSEVVQGIVSPHPEFVTEFDSCYVQKKVLNTKSIKADLAMISLFNAPSYVKPKPIPVTKSMPDVGDAVYAVGFGYHNCDDDGGLQLRRFSKHELEFDSAYQDELKISVANGSLPWTGDSGGPLIDLKRGASIVGVASWGACKKVFYYTNIALYLDWINEAIGICSQKAHCCGTVECIDIWSDSMHCGSCQKSCKTGEDCINGFCAIPKKKCGDEIKNNTEQCDATDLGEATCQSLGYSSGTLKCQLDCTYDTTPCCSANASKQCYGGDVFWYDSCGNKGNLYQSCSGCGCTGSNCSACLGCGDGIKNGTDQCDGLDLGVATCQSKGFASGTLRCSVDCTFDTSLCCTANSYKQCYNGDIYWYDSCGNIGVLAQSCDGSGCSGNNCIVETCSPYSYRCNGGNQELCDSDGGGWSLDQICSCGCSGSSCNSPTCSPNSFQCSGSYQQICDGNGCNWTNYQYCSTGCSAGHCSEICNGLDDDGDGVIDNRDDCWSPVYQFKNPASSDGKNNRCYSNTTTPPVSCSGWTLEYSNPVFWLYKTNTTGNLSALVQYYVYNSSISSDHALVRQGSADYNQLASGWHGYQLVNTLGYLSYPTYPSGTYFKSNIKFLKWYHTNNTPLTPQLYANWYTTNGSEVPVSWTYMNPTRDEWSSNSYYVFGSTW